MSGKKSGLVFLAIIFLVGAVSAYAQDANALLDLLVRKKLITSKEAEEVRAEMKTSKAKETTKATAPSGSTATTSTIFTEAKSPPILSAIDKWKLSTPIMELELYGDTRLRYEYRGGQTIDTATTHDDWQERKRERYRLRLGLRGTLADDWFFGVRLETSQNPRSTNVTFGDDSSTTSAGGGGPFAKGSDGINVGQAYLGYKGFKDITLTGGKMPNPLITTWMVWDPDINPEGAAEQWKHTFTFGGGGESPQSYSKDGKDVAVAKGSGDAFKLDVFANFGQFVYDDVNPENPLGSPTTSGGKQTPTTDAWLLAWQVGAKFTFPNTLYAQIAPTLYNYTGNGDTFNTHFQGGDPALSNTNSLLQNQTGINSLLVFDTPMEVGWKVGKLPMRVFADFAVNLEGDDRATAAGRPDKGDQRYAYQIGIGAGQLKKKHDWQLDVFWQHSEQYSLDPNLIDNDVFDARLNMEGVGARAGYMLSDAVWFYVTYVYAWRIDDTLGTGGANDIAINPMDQYQILQADLNLKF
ncbi:MAG: hypothetical protein QOG67_975 [Verrucomicrobiota bacterium]|jgi:hypothetical protein